MNSSSSSPVSTTTQTYVASSSDLKAHIEKIQKFHKDIVEWKGLLGANGFRQFQLAIPREMVALNQRYPEGIITISSGMITYLTSQFNKLVNSGTRKIVANMRKRIHRPSKQRAGFSIPQVYNQEILDFFMNAPLPPDCDGQDIRAKLTFFNQKTGIASQNMMRTLLMVYAYDTAKPSLHYYATANGGQVQGGQVDASDGHLVGGTPVPAQDVGQKIKRSAFGVDSYMMERLAPALEKVRLKKNQPKSSARPTGFLPDGRPTYDQKDLFKKFDQHNFELGSLQSIGAAVKITNPAEWTDAQKARLAYNPQTGKAGMTSREKAIYRQYVLVPEENIKMANREAKSNAKKNKVAYRHTDIPYNEYLNNMRAAFPNEVSDAIMTQLVVDSENQALTKYRACLRDRAAGYI